MLNQIHMPLMISLKFNESHIVAFRKEKSAIRIYGEHLQVSPDHATRHFFALEYRFERTWTVMAIHLVVHGGSRIRREQPRAREITRDCNS